MTQHLRNIVGIIAIVAATHVATAAQDTPAQQGPQSRVIPVKVQVVISRHLGPKEISRLPYTLALNANDGSSSRATLRMGAEVPIKSTAFTPLADGKGAGQPLTSYSYRNIGTSIDCGPVANIDGRYRFALAIEDSSVYAEGPGVSDAPRVADAPAFRSFRNSTFLALRDGESTQFAAATDRITGEVVRVEVTLNVVK